MRRPGCLTQALLLLVGAALLAVPLACLATLTAPLHSPAYGARVLCPPGSQPGERTLTVTCVDGQGNPVPANPRDLTTLTAGLSLYFPVCFGPTAILGLIGLLLVNFFQRRRRTAPAPPPAS